VPLTLLGLLLDGPLQDIGNVLLRIAAGSIALLERGLRTSAAFPWAAISVASLFGIAWLYIVLPVLQVLLPAGWPGRRLAWLGFVAVLLHRPAAIRPGCAIIDVLDVGHGLAAVIRTRQHVVLYDTGPAYRGGGNAAENIVLPFLRSRRISAIDRMLVSHADLDHAGGIAQIRAAVDVRSISASEPVDDIAAIPCRAGQSWRYDEVHFRILHPEPAGAFKGNDLSCVLLLESGDYRMLFSGDIEKSAEHSLLQRQVLPLVDAVLVPHHGSRTSSSPAFVRALRPSVAIVSAAFANHWGFPKPEVVVRWEAIGARVLNTATAGAIELQICADTGLDTIRRYRVDNRRIWHE
jgi:competence protein ComEC